MSNDLLDNLMYFPKGSGENLDKRVTQVVKLLSLSNKYIATAESCTGGLLSQLITSVSGASEVFEIGICTYANRIKHEFLGVPMEELDCFGAVSQQVALSMARGLRRISGADLCISVTGIAGPGGGTEETPVGTVYAGFTYGEHEFVKLLKLWELNGSRSEIRTYTALCVFKIAEQLLTGEVDHEKQG